MMSPVQVGFNPNQFGLYFSYQKGWHFN